MGRKEEKNEMTVEISGEGLSIRISRVLITRNYNYLPAQAAIILGKKFSLNNVSALPFGEFHFLEEKEREKRHENIYIYTRRELAININHAIKSRRIELETSVLGASFDSSFVDTTVKIERLRLRVKLFPMIYEMIR